MMIILTLMFFYFGFYAFYGDRGFRKYLYLSKEVEHARTLLEQYDVRKNNLDTQVKLISSDSLDLDMLEEQARIVLNYALSGDFVIVEE